MQLKIYFVDVKKTEICESQFECTDEQYKRFLNREIDINDLLGLGSSNPKPLSDPYWVDNGEIYISNQPLLSRENENKFFEM